MKHKIEIAPNIAIYIDGERVIGSKPHGLFLTTEMIVSDEDLKRLSDRCLEVIADTPQTERIKTPDYCDICNHRGCGNCIANNLDDYCVPSGYEPITQTETQNSNLTFENRTILDCYNCKRYKSDDACVECRYEPTADTPQTEKSNNEYYFELADAVMRGEMSDASANQAWYEYINKQDTPQTDCGWK